MDTLLFQNPRPSRANMTCPLTNKVLLGVLWKIGSLALGDIRDGVAGQSTTSTAVIPLYGDLFIRLLCMLLQQQYKVVKLLGRGVIVNIGFVN